MGSTSPDTKGAALRELGADHTINYRDTPEWGKQGRVRLAKRP